MLIMGSEREIPVLAKNRLKLPGSFQDRVGLPRMAEHGWETEMPP